MKKKKKIKEKAVKKKIKKSDDIIVVAKTPIQEIIKQTELAKKAKDKLKKVSKKKALPKKKKPEVKAKPKIEKKPEEITSDLYQRDLQQIDYAKLFEYLGSGDDAYSRYIKNLEYKENMVHEHSYHLGEEQLERLIRRELTNAMLFSRDGVKEIEDIKEKERFDYWKQFNRLWVMIKVDLLGFGYNG